MRKKKKIRRSKMTRRDRVNEYFDQNPSENKFREYVLNKQIIIGMSENLLIMSWGRPDDINETVTKYGIHK